jgi:hypothetical protein
VLVVVVLEGAEDEDDDVIGACDADAVADEMKRVCCCAGASMLPLQKWRIGCHSRRGDAIAIRTSGDVRLELCGGDFVKVGNRGTSMAESTDV